jgi:NAD(P)-dependent dehydrogenase (short-subunit alcohol dehydrogenase family)
MIHVMTTILITGASRGIGLSAATRLADGGATVIAAVRKPEELTARLQDHPRLDIRPIAMDITSDKSVRRAAAIVREDYDSLDVLINNAGAPGSFAPAEHVGVGDFTTVLETNLLGSVRVTQAFLPLLLRGDQPRLVMVSSGMGSLTLQSNDEVFKKISHIPYPVSKAALNMLAVQYAKALPEVLVTTVDPGLTATEFTGGSGHSIEEGSDVIVQVATDRIGPSGRFLDRLGLQPW